MLLVKDRAEITKQSSHDEKVVVLTTDIKGLDGLAGAFEPIHVNAERLLTEMDADRLLGPQFAVDFFLLVEDTAIAVNFFAVAVQTLLQKLHRILLGHLLKGVRFLLS